MPWFGFGFNGFGQLEPEDELTLNLPKPLSIKGANVQSEHIRKVAPSWSYSAFVTEDGSLILSGCISGCPQSSLSLPGLDCRDVLSSEKYLIVLLKERAECWEMNKLDFDGVLPEPMWKMEIPVPDNSAFPLLSRGHITPQPPFFRELSSTGQVQRLALGNEHAVLLRSDGEVLTWGAGRHGQLGHGDVEDVSEPRIVEALHGVPMCEVAAGGWHTASISGGGDIYCWGWNESGQLGLPSKTLGQGVNPEDKPTEDEDGGFISIQSFPALIDLPQEAEASKISCGSRHTATVTCTGELYTWGWGKYGQLGHGDTKSLDHPKRVEFFVQSKHSVKDVTCKYWNTYALCFQDTK